MEETVRLFLVLLLIVGEIHGEFHWGLLGTSRNLYDEQLQQDGDCDGVGELVERSGHVDSPGYPLPYPPNSQCRWVIRAQAGWSLRLQADDFHVEHSEGCLWDYLLVKEEGRESRRFCGHGALDYNSTTSSLELLFHSDPDHQDSGFRLHYTATPSESAVMDVCNVTFTESEGNFTSPNYPLNYLPDTTCTYLIQGEAGDKVELLFLEFDVEQEPCLFDSVSIYTQPSSADPIAVLCGSALPEVITSRTGSLYVVFQSDASLQSGGFRAAWRVLRPSTTSSDVTSPATSQRPSSWSPADGDADCYRELENSTGNTTSPGYPEEYPRKKNCMTVIRAPVLSNFDIKFELINMEYSPDCSYDKLLMWAENVTEGGDVVSSSQPPRQLCGFHPEENVFTFTGRAVRLQFLSDASVQLTGFLAYFFVTAVYANGTKGDDCPLKCQNGGTCYHDPVTESFRCLCPSEFQGELCEIRPPELCDNHMCEHGGSCVVRRGRPSCNCAPGYYGDHCETGEKKVGEAGLAFTKVPRNATVAHGSTVLLECAVSDPSVMIMWLHRDRLLLEEEHRSGVQVHPGGVLLIPEVEEGQDGRYTCMAMIPTGLAERSAYITLVEPCQLRVMKSPRDAVIQEGSNVIFECFVPEATVIWRKDGEILTLDKRKRMLVNNYLLIDRAVETDSGEYTCTARDTNGCFAKRTATLDVRAVGHGTACGRPKVSAFDSSGRISSGREAPALSAPWHVIIQEKAHDTTFCGGSLISDRWVLTAAHCVSEFQETFGYPFAMESMNLFVGTTNCKGQGGQHRRLNRIVLHPQFNQSNFDQDLALFELDRPVVFSDAVMPICLERELFVEELLKDGRVGVITGCGKLLEGGDSPLFLNEVKIPYVSRQLCAQRAAAVNATFTGNMLCAGYARSMRGDACSGDSGGPYSMEYHGRWILVGLVSWGVGCDRANQYGYYAHVSLYYDWIMNTTQPPPAPSASLALP